MKLKETSVNVRNWMESSRNKLLSKRLDAVMNFRDLKSCRLLVTMKLQL